MGKVGSTAILSALRNRFSSVYQVHSLVPEKLQKTKKVLQAHRLGIPKHVHQSFEVINKYLIPRKSLSLITPIRRPLERNISAFFQELPRDVVLKPALRNILRIPKRIQWLAKLPIQNELKNYLIGSAIQSRLAENRQELITYFKNNYRHDIPLNWFDTEFLTATGINIYDYPFNPAKGYEIIIKDNLKILLLQSELADPIKAEVINNFLGSQDITIEKKHQSVNKGYGDLLVEFKQEINTDPDFLARFIHSKFSHHFYCS